MTDSNSSDFERWDEEVEATKVAREERRRKLQELLARYEGNTVLPLNVLGEQEIPEEDRERLMAIFREQVPLAGVEDSLTDKLGITDIGDLLWNDSNKS